VSRTLCVLLFLLPSTGWADGSLGNYRQSALREDFSVSQWQDSCGPAPKSMQSGGGETVSARIEGDELVINGGGRVYRSNECYEPMPGLARDAHSRDPSGKSWRTRCSNPKNDPRRAVLQTQVTLGEGRIDLVETGKYEVTVSDGHCSADVRRTRSYTLIAAPAEPTTTPTAPAKSAETATEPPKPTGSCVSPGAPVRVDVKPTRKLTRPGEAFRVRVSAFDRDGCPVPAEAVWSEDKARGIHVDKGGLVKIDANAPTGSSELAVTIQGKRAVVLIETASADQYGELLRQSDLNNDGESLTGTSVVLDAQDERDVQTADQARTRKWVFGGVIAALTLMLAALYAWLTLHTKKREARAREEIEARYKEQLHAAAAKQRALEDEHAAQLAAHQESVEAREAKVRARKEREIAKANAAAASAPQTPLVCPVCSAEFAPPFQHCPKDGAALSANKPGQGHGFCPVCFRGYPASVRTCPEHHEDLVPALAGAREVASSGSPKGKICPQCGERFDGPIAFCGKDGTALVLVM
jgi:hypothetical protein